jgi:RNA polymerase sigma-70 factor (ECF subfamily)
MGDTPESVTRVTLLGRLRRDPTDQAAWSEFADRYSSMIYGWCRRRGLQHADAEEVTQEVLVKLVEEMRTFVYDPARSFRAWLKTVTQHTWSNVKRSRDRHGQGSGDDQVLRLLDTAHARDDLDRQVEELCARESFALACEKVRLDPDVNPQTWEAFRLTALEGLTGAEAARRTGLSVGHVFVAKHRVKTRLHEEIQKLDR